jgi:lipoprotein-releasing system permease protein
MLSFQVRGQWLTRQVMFIGIDESTHSLVSDFGSYLQHPGNRRQLSFALRESGYDTFDSQAEGGAGENGPTRPALEAAGWTHRRMRVAREKLWREKVGARADSAAQPSRPIDQQVDAVLSATSPESGPPTEAARRDPFRAARPEEGETMDPAKEQFTGIVPGIGLASFRDSDGVDRFLVLPGDDVKITFPTAGTPPKAVTDTFTIVDFYESKMSEYDSNFVFVPIASLQRMRGMIDPQTGIPSVNSIQVRLKPGANLEGVRDRLRKVFPAEMYAVSTWRDKQGPLLSAVDMEMAVLNILLFLIIAVAGFGILAIFFMIVVEKTRDIGILKSLGAGSAGIAGIFLGYGLFLGLVGAGAGLAIGLAITWNINSIRAAVEWFTGQRVFDPSIYYFFKIPTIVHPATICWIIVGAVAIAVAASVLPALRAARLRPVEALRHD